jgi:hypothetical protein
MQRVSKAFLIGLVQPVLTQLVEVIAVVATAWPAGLERTGDES